MIVNYSLFQMSFKGSNSGPIEFYFRPQDSLNSIIINKVAKIQ